MDAVRVAMRAARALCGEGAITKNRRRRRDVLTQRYGQYQLHGLPRRSYRRGAEKLVPRPGERYPFSFTLIGGAFHVPFSASSFGQYRRRATQNGPFGAGSQLGSSALPGDVD